MEELHAFLQPVLAERVAADLLQGERGGHGVFLLTTQQLRAHRLSLDID